MQARCVSAQCHSCANFLSGKAGLFGQVRTSSSLLLSQVTIKPLALSPTPRSFSQHASSSTLSIITSMLRILLLSCHVLCVFHLDFVLNSATKPFRPSRLDTLLQTPVQANTVTFNTMQTVLDASGQWAMATLLLDLMGLSTVKPDPQSFNIATQLHSSQHLSVNFALLLRLIHHVPVPLLLKDPRAFWLFDLQRKMVLC